MFDEADVDVTPLLDGTAYNINSTVIGDNDGSIRNSTFCEENFPVYAKTCNNHQVPVGNTVLSPIPFQSVLLSFF